MLTEGAKVNHNAPSKSRVCDVVDTLTEGNQDIVNNACSEHEC